MNTATWQQRGLSPVNLQPSVVLEDGEGPVEGVDCHRLAVHWRISGHGKFPNWKEIFYMILYHES